MPKKLITFICCILMFMAMGTDAFAASSPVVYADKVTVSGSEDVKVPIYIKDNSGLMGFHFVVKYDADKLIITNVTNSELTSSGLFNQNLNAKKGKFDVVWSAPENMTGQGPIFYIYLRADGLEEDTSIKLSYVEDDTFDASLQNVAVECKSIKVDKGRSDDSTNPSEENTQGSPEEHFLASEISEEVTSQLDEKEVISIIHEVAEEEGLDSIKNLKPEQARKILKKVKKKMEEQGLSTEYLDQLLQKAEEGEDLDSDSILTHAVKSMYKSSAKMVKNEEEGFEVQPLQEKKNPAGIIAAILIIAAIAAGAIVLFFRRKKERN